MKMRGNESRTNEIIARLEEEEMRRDFVPSLIVNMIIIIDYHHH